MREKAVSVLDSAFDDMSQDAAFDVEPCLPAETDALQAIAADWLDESERTTVMESELALHELIPVDQGFEHELPVHYLPEEYEPVPRNRSAVFAANDLFDDLDHAPERSSVQPSAAGKAFATVASARRSQSAARHALVQQPRVTQAHEEPKPPLTAAGKRQRVGASTIPARHSRSAPKREPTLPAVFTQQPEPQRVARTLLPPPRHRPASADQRTDSASRSGSRPRLATPAGAERGSSLAPWEVRRVEAHKRQSRRPHKGSWGWSMWLGLPLCAAVFAANAVWALRGQDDALVPEVVGAAAAVNAGPETGFTLSSNPSGAQIVLDGRPVGAATPAHLSDVTPGLHAIELRLPGYLSTTIPALSRSGETIPLHHIVLRPIDESRRVATPAPAPAPVLAPEPKPSAQRSPATTKRSVGSARVTRARGYSRRILGPAPDVEDTASDDQANSNATGTLRVNSRPWARVVVDGRFIGHTPQQALELDAGRHTVRLVNEPLHMSKTLDVTIAPGQTVTRVEMLEEQQ